MCTRTGLAGLVTLILITVLPVVAVADDEDLASVGDWIVLGIILAGLVTVVVAASILGRRDTNPHTGLPSKIKTRRIRGPLTKRK
jgi:hypothetical protein